MIIKSQNKDLVVDTYGNDFRMFCGPDGRYGIETRAGVVGVYKTKKKAEKVLDEIAEQIGCCKADEIIYAPCNRVSSACTGICVSNASRRGGRRC